MYSDRDHMLVGFTTSCAISTNHHLSCEFEFRSWRGVLDVTLCDKVCQWLATGQWYSPGPPVSSTNKTNRHHDIHVTEILLKVALNNITPTHRILSCHTRIAQKTWYGSISTVTPYYYRLMTLGFENRKMTINY